MWIVNNFSICKQRKLQSHVFRPARGHSCWPSQDRFLAPKNSNVKKYVNKYWTAFRPKDPTDLDFEVSFPCIYHNETVIDDLSIFAWPINLFFVFIFFLRRQNSLWQTSRLERRGILSEHQLDILQQAKRWFVDGTARGYLLFIIMYIEMQL